MIFYKNFKGPGVESETGHQKMLIFKICVMSKESWLWPDIWGMLFCNFQITYQLIFWASGLEEPTVHDTLM